MKYHSRPKLQLTSAGVAALGVILIGSLFYGEIDWPTVIGVALGIFLGLGFARKTEHGPSEDLDGGQHMDAEAEYESRGK